MFLLGLDKVDTTQIADEATALQMFLEVSLQSCGLYKNCLWRSGMFTWDSNGLRKKRMEMQIEI